MQVMNLAQWTKLVNKGSVDQDGYEDQTWKDNTGEGVTVPRVITPPDGGTDKSVIIITNIYRGADN